MDKKTEARLKRLALLEEKKKLQDGLPHLYGYPFYKWAREFFESKNRLNFLLAGNQLSKALEYGTEVLTPNGFKKIEDLQIGEFVIGMDGKPAEILDIPFDGEDECFEVVFDDGARVTASRHHQWVCKGRRERFRKDYTINWRGKKQGTVIKNSTHNSWITKSTEEIISYGGYQPTTRPIRRHSIPLTSPIETTEKDLFDPYLIGLLLGDGGLTHRSVIFTTADEEILQYVGSRYEATPTGKFGYRLNGLVPLVREIGIMGLGSKAKFVPIPYLHGSIDQRLAILQGLMDTDGTVSKAGICYFASISLQLAKDVTFLVNSLGGLAEMAARTAGYKKDGEYIPCNTIYQVFIKMQLCPFRLPRKIARHKPKIRYSHERIIYRIAPVGPRRSRCLTVHRGTFLCTRSLIVTHNSSTMIRKCIHWATDQRLWKELWVNRPTIFWYLYPTKEVANIEFEKKWCVEFLPRGEYKDHPVYGWKAERDSKGLIDVIHFNNGVSVYFKAYAQKVSNLQTASVFAAFNDEELPEEYFPEIRARLTSTRGYFHMAFTATLGQELWRSTMEDPKEKCAFPTAAKWQVSMYDCVRYEDGSPSPWTLERIKEEEDSCSNEREKQRRIYGRFVKSEGLAYPSFARHANYVTTSEPPPKDWHVYSGVDVGSGGPGHGHPSAVTFVAVRPDFKFGRIFVGWRGDGVITTAGDTYLKYIETRDKRHLRPVVQSYDWSSKDFHTIATRNGDAFVQADKARDKGHQLLNTLFRYGMLVIDDTPDCPELLSLVLELENLCHTENKTKAKDDFVDSMRYAVMPIPWDMSAIKGLIDLSGKEEEKSASQLENEERRSRMFFEEDLKYNELIESEISEWNDCYEV